VKDPNIRNEAVDCRVYARADAAIFGIRRMSERQWQKMQEALGEEALRNPLATLSSAPLALRFQRRIVRSSYLGGKPS